MDRPCSLLQRIARSPLEVRCDCIVCDSTTVWPSGLRRWTQVPLSSGAWVRTPQLSLLLHGYMCCGRCATRAVRPALAMKWLACTQTCVKMSNPYGHNRSCYWQLPSLPAAMQDVRQHGEWFKLRKTGHADHVPGQHSVVTFTGFHLGQIVWMPQAARPRPPHRSAKPTWCFMRRACSAARCDANNRQGRVATTLRDREDIQISNAFSL